MRHHQRIRVQNHGDRPFEVRLVLAFASDFADLFEVRGMRRARRGTATAELSGTAGVTLNYQGLDGARRRTVLQFEPVPERLSTGAASYAFELQPNESRSIYVSVKCDRGADENLALPFRKACAPHSRSTDRKPWHDTITTSNPDLQRGDAARWRTSRS
jgi:glycogen debranching enzyme